MISPTAWVASRVGTFRRRAPRPTAPTPEARVADLDGLRGLAILAVVAVHSTAAVIGLIQQGYPIARVDGLLYVALHAGWVGVDLFFVLSGYLITGILLKAKGQPGYYRNFYARRALRIMPLYYGVLLARLALSRVAGPWWLAVNPDEWVAHALYVGNFWQCHARTTGTAFDAGGLHVCWSLAVEEQFYLVWPVVVALASRAWLWRVCAAGVVAAVACRWGLAAARFDYWFTYTLPFCRMDGLLLGALVALAATSGLSARTLARGAWAVLALAAAGLVGVWVANGGPYLTGRTMTIIGFTVVDLFFAAALALVVAGQPAGWRVLRFRPLVLVGTHSYAVYLVHFPVILCAFALLGTDAARGVLLPVCEAVGSSLPLYLAWAAVVVGASLLIARVTWVLIERPCLGLKRFFPQRSGPAGTRTPPE